MICVVRLSAAPSALRRSMQLQVQATAHPGSMLDEPITSPFVVSALGSLLS